MLYLDTSALVKMVRPEVETPALREWLAERPDELLATSALAEVELVRALRRADEVARLPSAAALLSEVLLVDIDAGVRRTAADLGDPMLRSLDAVHLAGAYELRPELTAVITYDERMAAAVDPAIPVVAPGAAGWQGHRPG